MGQLLKQNDRNLIFLSQRQDGLGARLMSIVNGLVLQEKFGGQFHFMWDDIPGDAKAFHDVEPAESIFSDSFREAHLIDAPPEGFAHMGDLAQYSGLLTGADHTASLNHIIAVQHVGLHQVKPRFIHQKEYRERAKKAFSGIEFSDECERAREFALSIDLPSESVAIHNRAGDIVYGKHRLLGDFRSKAAPFPMLLEIARRLINDGCTPIFLGQDESLINWIGSQHEINKVFEIQGYAEMTPLQKAIFDICLMGRCKRIYAGTSAFAQLASRISLADLTSPYKEFEKQEAVELIHRSVLENVASPDIHPLQISYACSSALFASGCDLPDSEEVFELLEIAIEKDPGNFFYSLALAAGHFRAQRLQAGDNAIERFLLNTREAPEGMKAIEEHVRALGKRAPMYSLLPYLRQAAEAGSIHAKMVVDASKGLAQIG